MRTKLSAFSICLFLALQAATATPSNNTSTVGKSLLGKYGEWRCASTCSANQTKCHVTSKPEKSVFVNEKDKDRKRGRVYVLVSRLAHCADPAMVTIGLGYQTNQKEPITATIGTRSFELVSQGERAWALSDHDELQLIESMKKGKDLVITATSKWGRATKDTYSLKGFSAAWARAKTTCPAPAKNEPNSKKS